MRGELLGTQGRRETESQRGFQGPQTAPGRLSEFIPGAVGALGVAGHCPPQGELGLTPQAIQTHKLASLTPSLGVLCISVELALDEGPQRGR